MEVLHTILLGPYKYLLRRIMSRLSTRQKEEVQSIISAFNFSGFSVKVTNRLVKYFKSFVGRDFKAIAQCALFVFKNYFTEDEKMVWLALSKVGIYVKLYKIKCLFVLRCSKSLIVTSFLLVIPLCALRYVKILSKKCTNIFQNLNEKSRFIYFYILSTLLKALVLLVVTTQKGTCNAWLHIIWDHGKVI